MDKIVSFFEFQSVKNVARALEPHLREQRKIKAQLEKLAEEYKQQQAQIDALESGVVQILGYHVDELLTRTVETIERSGKPVNTIKYVLTDIVSYDDTNKQYIIKGKNDEAKDKNSKKKSEPEVKEEVPAEAMETPSGDQVPPEVTPDDFPGSNESNGTDNSLFN